MTVVLPESPGTQPLEIAGPALQQERLLRRGLFVLFRRKWLILTLFLGTCFGMLFGTFLTTPVWKGTARLLVSHAPALQVSFFQDVAQPADASRSAAPAINLQQIAIGQELAERLASEFGRDQILRKRRLEPASPRDRVNAWLRSWLIDRPTSLLVSLGLIEARPDNFLMIATQEILQDLEDIEVEEDTDVLSLGLYGESPAEATALANRLADLVAQANHDLGRRMAESAYQEGSRQLAVAAERLQQAERKVAQTRSRQGVLSIDDEKKVLSARRDRFEADRSSLASDIDRTRARQQALRAELGLQKEEARPASVASVNQHVRDLLNSLADLEVRIAGEKQVKTDRHPDVVMLTAQRDDIRAQIAEEVRQSVAARLGPVSEQTEKLVTDLVDAQTEEMGLQAKLEAVGRQQKLLSADIAAFPSRETLLQEFERERQIEVDVYVSLKRKVQEFAVLREAPQPPYAIQRIDPAHVYNEDHPFWPQWILMIPFSFIVSILLALFVAFFVDYWGGDLTNPEEVERYLEVPALGTVVPMSSRSRFRSFPRSDP